MTQVIYQTIQLRCYAGTMSVKTMKVDQLGRRIRSTRLKLGLSQEDVARPSYSAAYISHVEKGKRSPSQEALTHIAGKLGMTLDQLVSGRDPDEDLRLEVAVQRAVADSHSGQARQALEALEGVLRRAKEIGHARAVENAQAAVGVALFRLGRTEKALASFEQTLELLSDAGPDRRTTAVVGKARCLFHLGEVRESLHVLEAHLHDLERGSDPDPGCLVETYAALIPGYFESGMFEAAKDVAAKGWKLAPKIPDVERRACLYVNRAQLLLTQGEPREALASLALAEDLYRHLGWETESMKVALARSLVLTDQDRLDEAEALITGVLETKGSKVDKVDRVTALTRLASIRRRRGEPSESLALAQEALKLAGSGFKESAAEARREAGLAAMDLDDAGGALEHWRAALAGFIDTGDHAEIAKTSRLIAEHLASAGDTEGALEAFRQGIASMELLR